MPTRNTRKIYGGEEIYHIYTRGVAKQTIFLDDYDYEFFLSLFKRYLSNQPAKSPARVDYPWYQMRIELLAYCLMSNHIHLLLYQQDERAIVEFMQSLMTSYSMYFNKKYKRVGPVFQSRYLASNIDKDNYLEHISRYIHLNPKHWLTYKYSSLPHYTGQRTAEWLKPQKILELFNYKPNTYMNFLRDYSEHKKMLDEVKLELAHE